MPRDEIADEFQPSPPNLGLPHPLAEAQLWQKPLEHLAHRGALVGIPGALRVATPLGDHARPQGILRHGKDSLPPAAARWWKLAVVADRLHRATLEGFLAERLLLGSLGLLVDIAVPAVVVALEVCGGRLAAEVAIDALVIDEELPCHIVAVFVCCVSHIGLSVGLGKFVADPCDCNRFLPRRR